MIVISQKVGAVMGPGAFFSTFFRRWYGLARMGPIPLKSVLHCFSHEVLHTHVSDSFFSHIDRKPVRSFPQEFRNPGVLSFTVSPGDAEGPLSHHFLDPKRFS